MVVTILSTLGFAMDCQSFVAGRLPERNVNAADLPVVDSFVCADVVRDVSVFSNCYIKTHGAAPTGFRSWEFLILGGASDGFMLKPIVGEYAASVAFAASVVSGLKGWGIELKP